MRDQLPGDKFRSITYVLSNRNECASWVKYEVSAQTRRRRARMLKKQAIAVKLTRWRRANPKRCALIKISW